jgi:hypothetical protein
MQLPKHPGRYLVLLLLLILVSLAAWMFHALNSPVIQERKSWPANQTSVGPSLPPLPSSSASSSATLAGSIVIDPMLQQQADSLNDPDSPPTRDLEIVADFLTTYSRALGGNPIGDNADITAALTGTGGAQGSRVSTRTPHHQRWPAHGPLGHALLVSSQRRQPDGNPLRRA